MIADGADGNEANIANFLAAATSHDEETTTRNVSPAALVVYPLKNLTAIVLVFWPATIIAFDGAVHV